MSYKWTLLKSILKYLYLIVIDINNKSAVYLPIIYTDWLLCVAIKDMKDHLDQKMFKFLVVQNI